MREDLPRTVVETLAKRVADTFKPELFGPKWSEN